MSLLKFIKAQLGISSTPSNNFTLDASAQDGSLKLSRGNAGATTQDVMVVDNTGKVAFPAGSEMLGVGQTWKNVNALRTFGVAYTNTTGKPIIASLYSAASNDTYIDLSVNGLLVQRCHMVASGKYGCVSVVVPAGSTYMYGRANASQLSNDFVELS